MIRLPGADAAFVDLRKIADYLLNPAHPQNGGKAGFFFRHGFVADSLATSLADYPQRNPLAREQASLHGRKFVVHCTIASPDGRNPCITSIWIVDSGDDRPRLVTAYPRSALG